MSDYKKIKNYLDQISPTVCYAKWLWEEIKMEQGTTASCHLNPGHKIPKESKDYDLFNTEQKMLERDQMLQGKKPIGCNHCWNLEKNKILSDRLHMSESFMKMGFDNSIFDSNRIFPPYLSISLDNLCNMACSYCDNSQSSTWGNLLKKNGPFKNIKTDSAKRYQSIMKRFDQSKEDIKHLYEKLYDAIKKNTNKIKEIEFLGGEPSTSPNFWKTLDFLKTLDVKHINISLASNLCPSNNYDIERLIQYKPYFNKISVTGSVENISQIAEFTRYGTRWPDVETNMKKLIECGIELTISSTISALTVIHYDKFLDWIANSGHHLYNGNNFVTQPKFQHIGVLPFEIRKKCATRISQSLTNNQKYFAWKKSKEKLYKIVDALLLDYDNDVNLEQDLKNFYLQYCRMTGYDVDILGTEFASWIQSID